MPPRKAAVQAQQNLSSSSSSNNLTVARFGGSPPRSAAAGLSTKVPAFLNKLYSMVNDPSSTELIHWSQAGDSFFVPNHELFAKDILPRFFKHNNFSSFVRQLNMYGFHKVPHLQTGVLEPESSTELWEFVNPNFLRDQPDLLPLVQRKKTQSGADGASPSTGLVSTNDLSQQQPHASGSKSGAGPSHSLDLQAVVSAVAQVRNQQSSLSQELKDLQTSNAHLWQEALASRERHKRHQETTDRILRFLAGVFGAGAAGDMAEGVGAAESPASDAGAPDNGKGKGKAKAKRGVAIVPKDRGRLMIGDGRIGLAEEDHADAAGLEEIELPYADGENEEMEEISSSRFNDFSPTLNSVPQFSSGLQPPSRPGFNTRGSTSSIRNIDSPPEQRFKSLSPSENQPTPSSSSNHRQNSLALSFPNSPRNHHSTPQQAHSQMMAEEQPPSPQPLSPFSQWMNLDQGTFNSAQSLLSSLSDPTTTQQPNGQQVAGLLSDSAYNNHHHDPFSFPSPAPIPSNPSAYPLSPSTLAALSSTIRNDAAAVTISSPTSQLSRQYQSAEAIAAEVDALQTSISALVASLGLDANAEAQLRGELIDGPASGSGSGLETQHPEVDLFGGGADGTTGGEFDMSAFFVPDGNADQLNGEGSVDGLVSVNGDGGDLAGLGTDGFGGLMDEPAVGGEVSGRTRGKKRKSEGGGGPEDAWDGNGDGAWEAGGRKKR